MFSCPPSPKIENFIRNRAIDFARFDKPTGQYMASAFLIAQLGKNYAVDNGKRITGAELLSIANDILTDVQHQIGGGVIYLDSEDTQKLMQFYEHEAFYKFGERYSDEEEQRYIQYLRCF